MEIYDKELAHAIMDTEKSPDLQDESTSDGLFSV